MLDAILSEENRRDLLITAKITAAIGCGVASTFLAHGFFHFLPITIFAGPLMCGLTVGAFFGVVHHRKDFAGGIAVFFFGSIFVVTLLKIDASVDGSFFAFIKGMLCFFFFVAVAIFLLYAYVTPQKSQPTFAKSAIPTQQRQTYGHPINVQSVVAEPLPTMSVQTDEITSVPKRIRWSIKIRREIWTNYEKRCYYCGLPLDSWRGEHMHLDHRIPIARGGPDKKGNLRPACPECNLEKSASHYPELGTHRPKRNPNT